MIARSYIESNLKLLDRKFTTSKSMKESIFYSKLAILELCGWIEESMDDLALRCSRKHLQIPAHKTYIEKDIIKKTYGFDYESHFRRMLIHLIGLINFEILEERVDPLKRDQLKSTLTTLKNIRNTEAHTHIKGTTKTINAPSVTLGHFPAVYDGLIEYDRYIRGMSFK